MLRPLSLVALMLLSLCGVAQASDPGSFPEYEDSTARFQATYNTQTHGSFHSLMPDGPNSLRSRRDYMYTFSATAHWGMRLNANTELYFNPEVVQGAPFSGALVGVEIGRAHV